MRLPQKAKKNFLKPVLTSKAFSPQVVRYLQPLKVIHILLQIELPTQYNVTLMYVIDV